MDASTWFPLDSRSSACAGIGTLRPIATPVPVVRRDVHKQRACTDTDCVPAAAAPARTGGRVPEAWSHASLPQRLTHRRLTSIVSWNVCSPVWSIIELNADFLEMRFTCARMSLSLSTYARVRINPPAHTGVSNSTILPASIVRIRSLRANEQHDTRAASTFAIVHACTRARGAIAPVDDRVKSMSDHDHCMVAEVLLDGFQHKTILGIIRVHV